MRSLIEDIATRFSLKPARVIVLVATQLFRPSALEYESWFQRFILGWLPPMIDHTNLDEDDEVYPGKLK